jgi:hypothetical protein
VCCFCFTQTNGYRERERPSQLVPIMSRTSKIEQRRKSRKSQFLDDSAAAIFCRADTKLRRVFRIDVVVHGAVKTHRRSLTFLCLCYLQKTFPSLFFRFDFPGVCHCNNIQISRVGVPDSRHAPHWSVAEEPRRGYLAAVGHNVHQEFLNEIRVECLWQPRARCRVLGIA